MFKELCLMAALTGITLVSQIATATTFYVAKSGSNNNSCTQAQNKSSPKLTVGEGLSCLKIAGDTLSIMKGVYDENFYSWQVPSGSDWKNPVTIEANIPEGASVPDSVTLNHSGINSPGPGLSRRYIVIKNIIFDGGFGIGGGANGGTVDHIKLDGVELKNDPQSSCLFLGGGDGTGTDSWVTRSKLHDCGSDRYHHGIYTEGSNHLVEFTEIYNISGYGIHNYDPVNLPSNNVYRNNYIHDTGLSYGTNFALLLTSGSNNCAYNNLIVHNSNGVDLGGTNNSAMNNTVSRNGNGRVSCNNGGDFCYRALVVENGSAIAKNNIFFGNNFDSVEGTSTQVTNNLFVDPKFVNANAGEFQLLFGSPAIDKGLTLNEIVCKFGEDAFGKDILKPCDFDGNLRLPGSAFDIGAYEFGSSSQTTRPRAPANLRVQ